MEEDLKPIVDTEEQETLVLHVAELDAGVRLDSYLAGHIPDWSRARIQRLIEDGDVLVNARVVKSSLKVKPGDVIDVELAARTTAAFTPEPIPIDVVFEDEDLIVVNKPAGLVVHPGAGLSSGTLANALAYHFGQLSGRAGATRPGLVHRLDKDTSGLIVVAKKEDVHESLSDQFRDPEVFKSYVALAHGRVKVDSGRSNSPWRGTHTTEREWRWFEVDVRLFRFIEFVIVMIVLRYLTLRSNQVARIRSRYICSGLSTLSLGTKRMATGATRRFRMFWSAPQYQSLAAYFFTPRSSDFDTRERANPCDSMRHCQPN